MSTPSLTNAQQVRDFVETKHDKPYDAIDPKNAELPEGFVVCIIRAGGAAGSGLARSFAKAGASGLILAARSQKTLEATVKEVGDINPSVKVATAACDITSNESVVNIASTVKSQFNILSDDYNHRFAPISANLPGPMDRHGLIARLKHVVEVMSSFTVTIKQTWPNPSLRQVLVWAESETNFHKHLRDSDDYEEWMKRGEYMFLMTLDESGEKITDVLEFVDSKATEEIVVMVARALEKKSSAKD
ncbi:hypothetical protein DER44DRAFT_903125 [Fusarium oxysporum]|nr:hypothetical protein DER44DRAFT_903125 [Fusarium oxysporum]